MKRVTILFIIGILIIGISSCNNNFTETSSTTSNQENIFLIGDSYLDSAFSIRSEVSEENLKYKDEKKIKAECKMKLH